MLVTNLTSHCFVLVSGVIIQPSAVDVVVSDAAYQTDSGLNDQIDALQTENFISITSKPSDTFPAVSSGGAESPLVLTASAADELPLKLIGHAGQSEYLLVLESSDGQAHLQAYDGGVSLCNVDGDGTVFLDSRGAVTAGPPTGHPTLVPLTVYAATAQSANLFEAYDEDGGVIFKVTPDHTAALDGSAGEGYSAQFSVREMEASSAHGVVQIDSGSGVRIRPQFDAVPLEIRPNTGQTANLFEAYDEDGNLVAHILAGGGLVLTETLEAQGIAATAYITTPTLQASPSNPAVVPLQVVAAAGQTANLVEVYDELSALVFAVHADGSVHIKTGTSIIADL